VEIGASPMSRVVQRQPNNDLNQSPQTVDPTGKLSPGTTQVGTGAGVWRIPIHGLRNDPKAWAVVLIPNLHVPTVSDVDVDVLLHFHGYGAGYRVLQPGEITPKSCSRESCATSTFTRWSSSSFHSRRLGGSTSSRYCRRANRSRFGDLSTQSGAYLREVFARLIADGHLPNGTYPGNVTISATAAAAWLRAPRSRSAGHMADARICCFSTRLILNVSRKFRKNAREKGNSTRTDRRR
jgi:hypothetical protein